MQIVDLNNFDLIAIDGVDAKKFLQGQVTCDIDELTPAHSIEGAICNIKGRVTGDFRLLEFEDTCYLQLETGMADIVKPVLDKYMVFSRAESRVASDDIRRIGILGELNSSTLSAHPALSLLQSQFDELPAKDGDVAVNGHALLIKIPGLLPRYELWQFNASDTEGSDLLNQVMESTETVATDSWQLQDIQAGIIHIQPSLSEQHLPEALNYDISGLISFTKGCYTGQEIVARMYYRGTAKKRLFCGKTAAPKEQPATIAVYEADSQADTAGEILQCARDDNGELFLLAVLPTSAIEPGARILLNGNPESPVELLSLPYETDGTGGALSS